MKSPREEWRAGSKQPRVSKELSWTSMNMVAKENGIHLVPRSFEYCYTPFFDR